MKLAICAVETDQRGARLDQVSSLGAWWVQFGDQVMLYAAKSKWEEVAESSRRGGLRLEEHPHDVKKGDMYLVVQKGRLFQQEHPDVCVLLDKGRYLVVELSDEKAKRIESRDDPCFVVEPLKENSVVFDTRSAADQRAAPVAWVQNLTNSVTQSNFQSTLSHLVSYPTRYSTSQHYSNAATWCLNQLNSMGYNTRIENVSVGSGTSRNVIAEQSGAGSGSRNLVLIVAHLDSVNSSGGPSASAPGADDNASGSAGLLEIACVLQNHRSVHDLRLVLFGGEEQGLYGSKQYVANLPAAERSRIHAVINMDMIGTLNTSQPTVLIEGASVSQSVINDLSDAASTYTSLNVQTSLSPYASDHVPFINANLPAVLTIEGADGANSNIHTANDTLTHINYNLALEIIRMNVAATATAIGIQGGITVPTITLPDDFTILDWPEILKPLRPKLSGRYTFNGGASARDGRSQAEAESAQHHALFTNPIYELLNPIYLPDWEWQPSYNKLRFTLHIDIDGTHPLNVVSGTVAKGLYMFLVSPPHFIGRVTSNTVSNGARNLVVEDFSFKWPGTNSTIDRLEIALTGSIFMIPSADITFIDTAGNRRYGPYSVQQESTYFRDVEVEVDCEDGALSVEPYDTHTHPDRPANLPRESLTLENTFAKSGIKITRSSSSNVINTSEAGANNRWSYRELHDAMEKHWSAFANKPQWKMWLFLAELGGSDSLGGVMFDGDINEPGGVDRQGTALFTKCPFFHTVNGGYIMANPPEAAAVERELFFNLIHETGHAFNLAHSFQKQSVFSPRDLAWTPPNWMPLASDDNALSWMNYPDRPSPGYSAKWFYDRFRFRFDDSENLFLRHAPTSYVQMGNEDWFHNHGRVSQSSLDRRLELVVRSRKNTVEFGEPVFLELRLRNRSGDEVIAVHPNLSPSDGFVEIAVTNPQGERRPFIPITHTRTLVEGKILEPSDAIYEAVNLSVGHFGIPFKEPGAYRIEVSYRNVDGGTAAAVMQVWVRPPASFDDMRVVSELFNARIGRVLYFGGSRVMEDANDKIDWVCSRLPEAHPARYFLETARVAPLATPFKILDADSDRIVMHDPNPGMVESGLASVIENTEAAADAIGHITYRQVVDTYTACALEGGKRSEARHAQENLLGLFRQRNVVTPVVEEIEQRARELS